MAFPDTLQTVTVTAGPIYDAAGRPRAGLAFSLVLPSSIRILESGRLIPSAASAATGSDGIASVEVVATNSDGIDVVDFTYELRADRALAASGFVSLPASVPLVALEDLSPVEASDGVVIWHPPTGADLQAHIDNPNPHPAYDDVQSLAGLFENGIA